MKKILLIEDSPTDAKIIKDILCADGLEVVVAHTGAEGLRFAELEKPDLIVLDLILPDINGYEVCRKLKQDIRLKKILVVVLSAKDQISDITEAFHAGADDYIIKPPVPDFLNRKLKLYLGIH